MGDALQTAGGPPFFVLLFKAGGTDYEPEGGATRHPL